MKTAAMFARKRALVYDAMHAVIPAPNLINVSCS
jgi:hypothetical protein